MGRERMQRATRYHFLLVALHWLLAGLIIAALALGVLVLVKIPNSSPMKIEALRGHMTGGFVILVLMLSRLFIRARTAHPPAADAGNALFNALARFSHRALYALVLAQAGNGVVMALQAHLPEIVFLHRGSLPADFWVLPIRHVHYLVSRALMTVIGLHVAGALYHVLILRDGLLRRMWFGRRSIAADPVSASDQTSPMVQS